MVSLLVSNSCLYTAEVHWEAVMNLSRTVYAFLCLHSDLLQVWRCAWSTLTLVTFATGLLDSIIKIK